MTIEESEQLGVDAARKWFPAPRKRHFHIANFYQRGMPQEAGTTPDLRLLYVLSPDSRDCSNPYVQLLGFWPKQIPRDDSEIAHAFACTFCREVSELVTQLRKEKCK